MLKGVAIILLFYFLGTSASYFIGGLIPGSVCGMLLLFAALSAKVIKAEDVKGVATALTENMALFFVPIGVGIIDTFDLVSENIIVFVVVPLTTTAMVILAVGGLQQYLENLKEKKRHE